VEDGLTMGEWLFTWLMIEMVAKIWIVGVTSVMSIEVLTD